MAAGHWHTDCGDMVCNECDYLVGKSGFRSQKAMAEHHYEVHGIGDGQVHCHKCNGRGYTSSDCRKCEGTGIFVNRYNGRGYSCRTCDGSGTYRRECTARYCDDGIIDPDY